jgi:hypothetical protein
MLYQLREKLPEMMLKTGIKSPGVWQFSSRAAVVRKSGFHRVGVQAIDLKVDPRNISMPCRLLKEVIKGERISGCRRLLNIVASVSSVFPTTF